MIFRLLTWNINGLRAAIKKNLWTKILSIKPQIFAFQEIKCDPKVLKDFFENKSKYSPTELDFLKNYNLVYSCATNRKGYSGTCIFYQDREQNVFNLFTEKNSAACQLFSQKLDEQAKNFNNSIDLLTEASLAKTQQNYFQVIETQTGLNIHKFDSEGRVNILKFFLNKEKIALINGYYPQGGRGQFRIDYKLEFYQAILKLAKKIQQEGFHLVLCGDFNTTFTDIDLARPKENKQRTGCLPEEREILLKLTTDLNLLDAFRYFYPQVTDKYTYWDQITRARERNVGWRIDLFLISQSLFTGNSKSLNKIQVIDCQILDQVLGSDHCPVVLDLLVN